MMLVMLVFYESRYSHQWLLFVALGLYALSKVTEAADHSIYQQLNHVISGHTLKHLFAAVGCYSLVIMLKHRHVK